MLSVLLLLLLGTTDVVASVWLYSRWLVSAERLLDYEACVLEPEYGKVKALLVF